MKSIQIKFVENGAIVEDGESLLVFSNSSELSEYIACAFQDRFMPKPSFSERVIEDQVDDLFPEQNIITRRQTLTVGNIAPTKGNIKKLYNYIMRNERKTISRKHAVLHLIDRGLTPKQAQDCVSNAIQNGQLKVLMQVKS